jgi:uncharacterized protein YkwD
MNGLNTLAQSWTAYMASASDWRHNPCLVQQLPAGWTAAAENIARGTTPDAVVNAWINSPSHEANLVGDYTHIGIGYAEGGANGPYYTQDFAKY